MLKQVRHLFGRRPKNPPVAPPPVPAPSVEVAVADTFVMPFEIRPLLADDARPLARLFRHSIEQIAARFYPPEAIAAWAASADEPEFLPRLQQGITLVATLHGDHAGFAQLHPADHINMLYLSPDASGLGIATLLYQHLEDEARLSGSTQLSTHASLAARRFFESVGFTLEGEETVERGGVPLVRYRMSKQLVNAP